MKLYIITLVSSDEWGSLYTTVKYKYTKQEAIDEVRILYQEACENYSSDDEGELIDDYEYENGDTYFSICIDNSLKRTSCEITEIDIEVK